MELAKLKSLPLFDELDEEELNQVKHIIKEKRFREKETIMKEGDEGDTMYLVLEGEVEVSKTLTMKFGENDYRETDKILTCFRAEDHVVFGEMALIARDTRSATVVALGDCILLEISRSDFLRVLESSPGLGSKLLFKICQLLISRLRQSSQDITRLTTALSIALGK